MAENADIKWYVVHTYSGYENKVRDSLLKAVENNGMQDKIVDVRIPVEEAIEIRNRSLSFGN
jgi:transcriptional antiterminator NusG